MNTQTQEALKMAIEWFERKGYSNDRQPILEALQKALEQPSITYEQGFAHGYEAHRVEQALEQPLTRDWKKTIDERIAKDDNFKEALVQPAQDFFEKGKEIAKWADKQNEQPAQEPVAWMDKQTFGLCEADLAGYGEAIPLYTHPAPSSYQSNGKLSYSEELAYQTGFEAGREFERSCDD